jgi:hypothetical protein
MNGHRGLGPFITLTGGSDGTSECESQQPAQSKGAKLKPADAAGVDGTSWARHSAEHIGGELNISSFSVALVYTTADAPR